MLHDGNECVLATYCMAWLPKILFLCRYFLFYCCVCLCCRYENDELKPYVEPEQDLQDHKRIETLVCLLGYNRADIEQSLQSNRYDDVFATYLLLGRKSTDVS